MELKSYKVGDIWLATAKFDGDMRTGIGDTEAKARNQAKRLLQNCKERRMIERSRDRLAKQRGEAIA